MRADTHHGPEQKTLHNEAGYIDAGPLAHHENPSCNARSVHTLGQVRRPHHPRQRGPESGVKRKTSVMNPDAISLAKASSIWSATATANPAAMTRRGHPCGPAGCLSTKANVVRPASRCRRRGSHGTAVTALPVADLEKARRVLRSGSRFLECSRTERSKKRSNFNARVRTQTLSPEGRDF